MFLTVSDIPKIANLAIKEKNNIDKKTPKVNKIVVITFEVLKLLVKYILCNIFCKIVRMFQNAFRIF